MAKKEKTAEAKAEVKTEVNTEEKVEATPLVRIKVVETFRDKFDNATLYEPGTELEFEPERAADVVGRKLAEYVETGTATETTEQS